MVSIIVPVYNVEAYLERCIESLLGQTYRNIEIILIDDGSDDASKEICDRYAAADSRVYRHRRAESCPRRSARGTTS